MIFKRKKYRRCAGIVIFNAKGQVLLGKRAGSSDYVWQLPQGGLDKKEHPRGAALREMQEETGIAPSSVEPLGEIKQWLFYDFPPELSDSRMAKKWCGQKQKWFAFLFKGRDTEIDLNIHEQIEFIDWRWGTLQEAVDLIVPFKRPVYQIVAKEFAKFETSRFRFED